MKYIKNMSRDALTDCYPKDHTDQIIDRMMVESNADKKPFSVLVLDMDHFKSYNDKYGHLYGDELLKYFAGMLHLSFKDSGYIPIRFGGDEFIVVFPGKDAREALALANVFRVMLKKKPFLVRGQTFNIHFSAGMATYPWNSIDTKELLDKADKAMYYSKAHGRGRITHYEIFRKVRIRRLVLVSMLALFIGAYFAVCKIWQYSDKAGMDSATKTIRGKIDGFLQKSGISIFSSAPADNVYMKSGRHFSGKILSEDAEIIKFRLNVTRGQGFVIIKKSDISRIERAEQPPK